MDDAELRRFIRFQLRPPPFMFSLTTVLIGLCWALWVAYTLIYGVPQRVVNHYIATTPRLKEDFSEIMSLMPLAERALNSGDSGQVAAGTELWVRMKRDKAKLDQEALQLYWTRFWKWSLFSVLVIGAIYILRFAHRRMSDPYGARGTL
jgi:hypothetical protein